MMSRDELAAIEAEIEAVLAPVTPPLYSLGARRALEIAERIARDAGRDQVEIDDIRRALKQLR